MSASQTDVVVDGIKRRISEGRFPPGSRLPTEHELSGELGVSRGSLREGVRALAIMGVLEPRQGDGTYVTSLGPEVLLAPMNFLVELHPDSALADLHNVRRVLEMEAAARAATNIEATQLQRANDVLITVDGLLTQAAHTDYTRFINADIEFHRLIAHASGNATLEALVEALASHTVRARMWRAISDKGALSRTHAEHRAILDALTARDPEAARAWATVHIAGVEQWLASVP